MPSSIKAGQARGPGSRSARSFSTVIRIEPAAIHLIAAINSGGIDSSAMRIARYVVPQTTQTIIQAT